MRLFGISRIDFIQTPAIWPWPSCSYRTMAALTCCVLTPNSPAIFKPHDSDARGLRLSISRRIHGFRDGVSSSNRWELRNHSSFGRWRARAGRHEVVDYDDDEENALASCVEVGVGGSKYLHVMAAYMHNVDHGSIIGLTCIPITKGQSSAKKLEFPLFLNALAAVPIKIAVEKGGLPHGEGDLVVDSKRRNITLRMVSARQKCVANLLRADNLSKDIMGRLFEHAALEDLGNLNDLDLQKIYVNSLDDLGRGGDFLVLDEKKGNRFMVASTFPQAIAVALRYRRPFYLKRETLLSANADFVNRMLINPSARNQDGDVEWLAGLSETMCDLVECQMQLQAALASAVGLEQYEEALRLKQELILYDAQSDCKMLHVLKRLRTLYLERIGIFFKL